MLVSELYIVLDVSVFTAADECAQNEEVYDL